MSDLKTQKLPPNSNLSQFDYGASSGELNISGLDFQNVDLIPSTPSRMSSTDSVTQYFLPTQESEKVLDDYMNGLINSFLSAKGPINAGDLTMELEDFKNPIFPTETTEDGIPSYFDKLKTSLIDKSTKTGAPEMIGHMTTALPFFHRPLAKLLATLNQNLVKTETSSTFTALERQTIAILHQAFFRKPNQFYKEYTHSPGHSLGVLCSGGTIANITAMWIARNKALGPSTDFPGIAKLGLSRALQKRGYSSAVIIGSEMMHYSFKKAADILGIGEDGLLLIETNENYQLRVDLLKKRLEYCMSNNILVLAIVAIAGTTETGSIDPLLEICMLGKKFNTHVHIDAAWGGPLIFSREHSYKMKGIDQADTITVDGHKQLYTPLGIGILLLKSPTDNSFIRKTASYVIRQDSFDLGKYTLEGSRPGNSLHLHASLNLLGENGLNVLLTRSITLVKQMAERLKYHPSKAFEIMHEPQTNILLFRYIPAQLRGKAIHLKDDVDILNKLTNQIHEYYANNNQDIQGFLSKTTVRHHEVMATCFRVVIANPLTEWRHIELNINQLLKIGQSVEYHLEIEGKKRDLISQYPFETSENGFWPTWPFDL